ncbi:MAG TPA: FHA domain-containing protein [Thermoanaerobaculia bacterium]
MIVECDRCSARYSYQESRFGGKTSKRVRCAKCGAVFEIYNTRVFESQPAVRPTGTGEATTISRHSGDTGKTRRPPPPGLRPPSPGLHLPKDRKISLAVIAGAEAGRIFAIDRPRIVLGRQDADISVEDAEVSRQHAAIEVTGPRVRLLDLGSTNGTFLGEEQVDERDLENQDEFTIGGTTLMLIVTEE